MTKSPLQAELRKTQPFESLEQEAFLNIARTHNLLAVPFSNLFREYNLSPPQYNILRILRGHAERPLPCTEIGEQMVTAVPDTTRLIDRLEQAGLAERHRCPQDRRVVHVRITQKGLDLLAVLDPRVLQAHKECLGHMTREELETINRLMAKARRCAETL